jgi:hypothetical protein
MTRDLRPAVASRDAAVARVRRLTAAAAAVGLALVAAFAALAATSTHLGKVVVRHAHPRAAPSRTVTAPVPPLVAPEQSAPTPTQSPAPAPAPQAAPPVVVSGGS